MARSSFIPGSSLASPPSLALLALVHLSPRNDYMTLSLDSRLVRMHGLRVTHRRAT